MRRRRASRQKRSPRAAARARRGEERGDSEPRRPLRGRLETSLCLLSSLLELILLHPSLEHPPQHGLPTLPAAPLLLHESSGPAQDIRNPQSRFSPPPPSNGTAAFWLSLRASCRTGW